jgi:hypothetical protein
MQHCLPFVTESNFFDLKILMVQSICVPLAHFAGKLIDKTQNNSNITHTQKAFVATNWK